MAEQTDRDRDVTVQAVIDIDPGWFDKLLMGIYWLTELGQWDPEKNPFHALAGAVIMSVEHGKVCLIKDPEPEGD